MKRILVLLLLVPNFCFGFLTFASQPLAADVENVSKIARSIAIINRYYYDEKRIQPQKMLEEGLNTLSVKIPEMLTEFHGGRLIRISIGTKSLDIPYSPPTKIFDVLKPVASVFRFIQETYKGDITNADQQYAFISGMLATLDPHTNILTPDIYKEFKTQTEGEYGGIGIVVGIKDDELSVVAPLEGTPAAVAGIQADDKIRQIDDLSTINMPLSEAVDLLRGKVNTTVTLLINRKKREDIRFNLIRKIITIESVKSKVVERDGKRIGILGIRSFQEETFRDANLAIQKMGAVKPLNGLVLDMRNNPGGLLDQCLELSDKFLSKGDILFTVGPQNQDLEVTQASPNGDMMAVPMVVLINEGSASASEIVAGALKNNNRAVIMGEVSFGKGSVQSLYNLRDGSTLKMTMAQYLTPGRISIQAVGISPDIQVIPAFVDKELDLLEGEHFGEMKLDAHLENDLLAIAIKPFYRIRYLDQKKKEAPDGYTIQIDEKSDYLLGLATHFLLQTPGIQRPEMLVAGKKFLKSEEEKQDKLLADALKKIGIDWSPGPKPNKVSLKIKTDFLDEKTKTNITHLAAGTSALWKVQVTNLGAQAIHRVTGIVEAKNPFINEREFILGKIGPGETKSATITIKIPDEMLTVSENAVIHLHANETESLQKHEVATNFVSRPGPEVSYQYQILDNQKFGSIGNGNGVPEKGETIALEFKVKNRAQVLARDMAINMKNLKGRGIFLERGRADLKDISPGETKMDHLIFKIDPTFQESTVEMDLAISDQKSRLGVSDKLVFPLGTLEPGTMNPPTGKMLAPPSIQISSEPLSGKKSLSLKGLIQDDEKIGDLMIFSGGKKIFYKSGDAQALPFQATVPLEAGINIITIKARDQRRFLSQKILTYVVTN